MSRNLGQTNCRICGDDVALDEAPRIILDSESGPYADEYRGMTVANARCRNCDAKYLAWVSLAGISRGASGHFAHVVTAERPFVDLSFRAAFNDEPAPDDLPTPECLKRIHARETFDRAGRLRAKAAEISVEAQRLEHDAVSGESCWEGYRRL